jgi:polyhydroxyalkanoate synthesis regulator phasin
MDERADRPEAAPDGGATDDSGQSSSARDLVEQLLLAGMGAVSLTREKADGLLDDLAQRGKLTREDADAIRGDLDRVPRGGPRLGERASAAIAGVFRELGLVTEPAVEELELRVAQLEHRLRLLERKLAAGGETEPPA